MQNGMASPFSDMISPVLPFPFTIFWDQTIALNPLTNRPNSRLNVKKSRRSKSEYPLSTLRVAHYTRKVPPTFAHSSIVLTDSSKIYNIHNQFKPPSPCSSFVILLFSSCPSFFSDRRAPVWRNSNAATRHFLAFAGLPVLFRVVKTPETA